MPRFAVALFWSISILFILPTDSADGDCVPIAKSEKPEDAMPNIFEITQLFYQLTVEANLGEQSKTVYATEYYDKDEARGRVDTVANGEQKRFLYRNLTNEAFTSYSYTCISDPISKAKPPHDDYGVYGWNNPDKKQPIFGPSNLLRDGYNAFKTTKGVGKEPSTAIVRGIQTNVWKQCRNNNKMTVRYFFIDSKTDSGVGIHNVSVPARVTVEGTTENNKQIKHTYDIVNYNFFIPEGESVFDIPTRVGCKRLTSDVLTMPVYYPKDFNVEAELVYTPVIDKDTYSYVNNIGVTYDAKSGHLAYSSTTWKAHKDGQPREVGSFVNRIYDQDNDIVYNLDKGTNECSIKSISEAGEPKIVFPDAAEQSLDLLDRNIFLVDNETVQQFHYLGKGVERGLPVNIFERKIEPEDESSQIIITRYHLADHTILDSEFKETNAPIKIVYWKIGDAIEKDFLGIAVINLYAFSSKFSNKPSKFDVTTCFPKDEDSKWFQIQFPLSNKKADDFIPLIPYIQDNFLDLLARVPIAISPLRIPKIIVDVDQDYVYVTALLLQRPNFFTDFEIQGSFGIPGEAGTVGITTKDGCAKACLEKDGIFGEDCVFFSYCGAICKVSAKDPFADDKSKGDANKDCELYKHVRLPTSIPTMDEISHQLKLSIDSSEFYLLITIPATSEVVTLPASNFKDGIAFGIEGLVRKPEVSIDERFATYKSGYKLKSVPLPDLTPMGVQSYAACKRACLNSPECESISFCTIDSKCDLSRLHGEELEDKHLEANSQCIILSRTYEDYFDKFPGLVLTTSALEKVAKTTMEGCAKACVAKSGCKSFDFCKTAEDASEECLLHSMHFLSVKENVEVKNKEGCEHYSKKLIYDFNVNHGATITQGTINNQLGAVSAEQCAKACIEDSAVVCTAFEYCQEKMGETVCRLTSSIASRRTTTAKATCNVYERSEKEKKPVRAQLFAPDTQGYSKSTVGGVSFFLFLIGGAIGVGAMYGFGYYRANRRT